MFGMELWFVLAVFSAFSGGIFIFLTKVAAERNYDGLLLSTITVVFSGVLFLIATAVFSDFGGITKFLLLMTAINSFTYMWTNLLRHDAMQCIDTAVYYPIYKTLTPVLVIAAGLVYFREQLSTVEWIGIVLSLFVPLLLITNAEKTRQKDLFRGLKLLTIAAVLGAVSAVTIKAGTNATDNTWLFMTLVAFGIVGAGLLTLLYSNGKKPIGQRLQAVKDKKFCWLAFWMGVTTFFSFASLVFAIDLGTLSIVYTVQSLYILIPIVLSIIYYNEHWNPQKVFAIVLSIAALALLK